MTQINALYHPLTYAIGDVLKQKRFRAVSRMLSTKLFSVILSSLFMMLVLVSCASKSQPLRLDEIPGDVEFTLHDAIGEGRIDQINRHQGSDMTWYSVEYTIAGEPEELFITSTGVLLEDDPGNLF